VTNQGIGDGLASVFRLAGQEQGDDACETFQQVLSFVVFSLQNAEVLRPAEKSLLMVRGVIDHAVVRGTSLELNPHDRQHILFLINKILRVLRQPRLPRNPAVSS
jgi:hypothetical protein